MNKKRILLFCVLSFLIFMVSSNLQVYADFGPKASVVVNIKGFEDEKYMATLVAKDAGGPNYTYEEWLERGENQYLPYHKIMEYKDDEGYIWIGNHWELEGNDSFTWGYYPPYEFKIVLMLEDGTLYSSQVLERYAFNSYYDLDVEKAELIDEVFFVQAKKSYKYGSEILSFFVRLLVTILLEMGLLYLFGYRKTASIKLVLLVNIITQIVLNLLLNIVSYYQSFLIGVLFYIFLEFIIIIAEGIVYYYGLKEHPKRRAIFYAILANLLSFGTSLVIYFLILEAQYL